MKIGIDQMSFFSPHLYIEMSDLAQARGEDPNKYLIGIGQTRQAVIPLTQDAVTMGANAAAPLMTDELRQTLDLVIFATESGIDQSKSGAAYLQRLLGIQKYARTIELKQACYSGTYGLMQARDYVAVHPDRKVLVVASDVARYGLKTSGEVTQGGGAVAMLVSADPQILTLENDSQFMTDDVMDFWRPNYATEARVDGKYSSNVYQEFFKELWDRYRKQTGRTIDDFDALVFHLPYTKMGKKGLQMVLPEADELQQKELLAQFAASQKYSRQIGNLYTGSLYLSLLSLLNETPGLKPGARLGLFSYGSGAEGEFYSGILQPKYHAGLVSNQVSDLLSRRQGLSIAQYEQIFEQTLQGSADRELEIKNDPAQFVLAGLKNERRQYLKQH